MIPPQNQSRAGADYSWMVRFTWSMLVFVAVQHSFASNEKDSSARNPAALSDSILRVAQTAIDSFVLMDAQIQADLPKADKAHADSQFFAYRRFVKERLIPDVGRTYERFIDWFPFQEGPALKNKNPNASTPLSASEIELIGTLFRGGIRMHPLGIGSRGIFLVDFRYRDRFKPYVSPDLGEVIELKERERAKSLDGDGSCGIGLSIAVIAERVAACESFLIRYPWSKYAPIVESMYSQYLRAFLVNSENHEIILGQKGKSDVLPVYRNYIRKYPERESASYVRRFLALRMANGYRQPESMEDSLRIPTSKYHMPDFE
jgi:hypothetical protein